MMTLLLQDVGLASKKDSVDKVPKAKLYLDWIGPRPVEVVGPDATAPGNQHVDPKLLCFDLQANDSGRNMKNSVSVSRWARVRRHIIKRECLSIPRLEIVYTFYDVMLSRLRHTALLATMARR